MPEDNITRRSKFYNSPEVALYLTREGVPKTKDSMIKMISVGERDPQQVVISQEAIECFSKVVFSIHPQQINIRDKENGKIIATIPR